MIFVKRLKETVGRFFGIKAVRLKKKKDLDREMIFDFTDVERLQNSPVIVKIPGKDGSLSVKCWIDSCYIMSDKQDLEVSVPNSENKFQGSDGRKLVEVIFEICKDDEFETSFDLYKNAEDL